MSTYEVLITIHVLGVVVWVGGSILMLTLGYYLRGRDLETRVEYTRWTEWVGPRLIAPAAVAVIIGGPMLVTEVEGFEFDQLWITLGFVGWTISFLLGVGFYPRAGKRRERLIEQHGIEHESVVASVNRVLTVATFDTLVVTLVVIDMTTKPGL